MPADPISGEGAGDEVTAQILDAAATIFARQGPASVTVKWICLEARVTPEELLARWPDVNAIVGAVLDDLADRVEAVALLPVADEANAVARIAIVDRYQRIVARSLLDGLNPAELQTRFPVVDHLVARGIEELGLDERSARYRVSQIYALEWGWRLFGPHLIEACGLDGEPDELMWAELWSLEDEVSRFPPVTPRAADRPD